jgi:hypothetical protein
MATESHVRLAARLYEMRDAAKRLLGDRYAQHMADIRAMLETAQSRLQLQDPLTAATRICVANELGGLDVVYIMSGACEMIESISPSTTTEPPK